MDTVMESDKIDQNVIVKEEKVNKGSKNQKSGLAGLRQRYTKIELNVINLLLDSVFNCWFRPFDWIITILGCKLTKNT